MSDDRKTEPAADDSRSLQVTHGPLGSAFEHKVRKRKPRSWKRRLRSWISRPVVAVATWVIPRLYYGYCWFVWKTSVVDDRLAPVLNNHAAKHGRFVSVLWHEEVVTVAYAFKAHRGHTLASPGDFGRVITRMLEMCNFIVFRGGSSKARSRSQRVLQPMIERMKTHPRVIYGLTVDGSKGPRYRMKRGAAVIAQECNAAIMCARTWYKRRLTLKTWDRTAIPLPFNRIRIEMIGPYWIDPEADDKELELFRSHVENELLELCHRSYAWADGKRYKAPPSGFPDGWQAKWTETQVGTPRIPYDLSDNAPPWAHMAD